MLKEVEQIIRNRGLTPEQIEPYTEENFPEYMLINVDKAVKQFERSVMTYSKIGVLYDVDVDGLASGKIITEYLRLLDIHPKFMMNSNKAHGMRINVMNWVYNNDIDYLIVVDAGTHDSRYFKELNDNGVKVLVLDHHDVMDTQLLTDHSDPNNTVIVNCYYEGSPNPYLSGAGVVYRFIREMDKIFKIGGTDKYKLWVGLSVLSDSCNILDRENRHYVKYLYDNYTKDPLFNMFKNYGSLETMFNFTIIPLINSCIRMGKQEIVLELITNSHPKNLERLITSAQATYDTQKQLVDKTLEDIKTIPGVDVVVSTLGSSDYDGIIGLMANKIRFKYNKATVLLVRDDNAGIYRGSFRGTEGITTDTLNELGIKTIGHKKAAGVFIEIDQFKEKVRDLIQLQSKVNVEEVTHEYTLVEDDYYSQMKVLWEIAHLNEFSGNGFEKISVKIKDLKLTPVVMTYEKVIRYKYYNFELVDFSMGRNTTKQKAAKEIIVKPVLKGTSFTLVLAE